jgi:hypothetical protein
MTRIVTTHYRYKRPPRKRKAVAVEAPAVVITKSSRRQPVGRKEQAAAEVRLHTPVPGGKGALQPSTPRAAARVAPPANDDRKPAIVTIKRKSRFGDAPELTPEEHQRRGEAADAMWRGLVDQATAKDGKSAAVSAGASSPATKSAIATTGRKRRNDGPHLPMELPLPASPSSATGTTTSG